MVSFIHCYWYYIVTGIEETKTQSKSVTCGSAKLLPKDNTYCDLTAPLCLNM